MFTNQEQTNEERKAKYIIARRLGFSSVQARMFRDYRTTKFIVLMYHNVRPQQTNQTVKDYDESQFL